MSGVRHERICKRPTLGYLRLLAAVDGYHLALALDIDCSPHAAVNVHLRAAKHQVHLCTPQQFIQHAQAYRINECQRGWDTTFLRCTQLSIEVNLRTAEHMCKSADDDAQEMSPTRRPWEHEICFGTQSDRARSLEGGGLLTIALSCPAVTHPTTCGRSIPLGSTAAHLMLMNNLQTVQ